MTSSRFDAPEVIRRIGPADVVAIKTTMRVLRDRGIPEPEQLADEVSASEKHVAAVTLFAERMSFGAATSYHPEAVLDFLIREGWTPPAGVYFLNPQKAGQQ